jgi:type IV secretory pathway protease TraF
MTAHGIAPGFCVGGSADEQDPHPGSCWSAARRACCCRRAGCSQPAKRLIFNTTASAPLGFYWLADDRSVGDLALVRPPLSLARWMAIRGYLPLNVPLIKHVAAVGGQSVCGRGGMVIRIDGRVVARC